jgi:primosomal protein N'
VSAPRLVSVAVDAAGAAGQRAFTYAVPASLQDLEPGEAVLVEFGRRQALGLVLGEGEPVPGVVAKPVLDRVRADGPLLPALSMRLAAWISAHYLAPPSVTLRAMLPPGLLERLELVAERKPAGDEGDGAATEPDGATSRDTATGPDAAILAALDAGPRQVRTLDAPEGRPALLRRLRGLAADGLVALDWTLLAAGAGPRWIRYVELARSDDQAVVASPPKGLGPRQVGVLEDLQAAATGLPAPELAARHGSAAIASLVRRGLITIEPR